MKMLKNNLETKYLVSKNTNITDHLFVFLEIFAKEGGIQSYVKDIFQSYLGLPSVLSAEVFLLRDTPNLENPFESSRLKFHYFKN